MTTQQIPAGWYDDPGSAENERYWDGAAWTASTRLKEVPSVEPQQVSSPALAAATQGSAVPTVEPDPAPASASASLFTPIAATVQAPAAAAAAPEPEPEPAHATAPAVAREPGPASQPEPTAPRTYEYKVLTPKDPYFRGKYDAQKLEGALNAHAEQGWRVVSVSTTSLSSLTGTKDDVVVVLER